MALKPGCHPSFLLSLPLLVSQLQVDPASKEILLCQLYSMCQVCLTGHGWCQSCHSTPNSWGALSAGARMWLMEDFFLCISRKSWMKPDGLSRSPLPRDSRSFASCFLLNSARQGLAVLMAGLSSLQTNSFAALARLSFRLRVTGEWLPGPVSESHSFSETGLVLLWRESFSLSSSPLEWVSSRSLSFPWFLEFFPFWWIRWWRTKLCFRVNVRSQVWHL